MTATAAEPRPPEPESRPPGRRERKKQRTREALVDAAFALFARKGFDSTTVEEIADAVDVSSRTFFRYFSSKEDVALTFQEDQFRAVVAALAARPADEPIMTALRRTVVGIATACERGDLGFSPERFQCVLSLQRDSGTLMAGSLEHAQKKQAEMTRIIADRLGVDPATDMRPSVIAAAATGAFQAAADAINAHGAHATITEAVDQAFAILEEGLNVPSAASRRTEPGTGSAN
ncbi:TetR family transcriptional regulator [Actinomadura roseirufa]|uniref:TetR family transcriptional regulator n=1 Tax=Actinomadura roseirufa TaxID=2094049 RepID=UPI001041AF63|nr:TetR family transcriptional regulator [Actinomadura roseirufa]